MILTYYSFITLLSGESLRASPEWAPAMSLGVVPEDTPPNNGYKPLKRLIAGAH